MWHKNLPEARSQSKSGINLSLFVCVFDSSMTSLADDYQYTACLALLFLFVFEKWEEQVCDLYVCV